MTDQIREQLSALLDGELPRDEMGLLLRRLEKDPALRRTFGSYALIGETLRAPGGRIAAQSFAAPSASPSTRRRPAAKRHPLRARRRPARCRGTSRSGNARWFAPHSLPARQLPPSCCSDPKSRRSRSSKVAGRTFAMSASPTPAQSQRLAGYMVAHSQFSTPIVRRNVLSSLLAADPGITRVSYEMGEAPWQ